MLMVRDLSSELDDVKEDVRAGNVTLGWIAVGELDCTRLVFIFPAPRARHVPSSAAWPGGLPTRCYYLRAVENYQWPQQCTSSS